MIAHHSVPLAITLENLWEAEEKSQRTHILNGDKKDAVQVRILTATATSLSQPAKFDVFYQWYINAAASWKAPSLSKLHRCGVNTCTRTRSAQTLDSGILHSPRLVQNDDDARLDFQQNFRRFLTQLWQTAQRQNRIEIQNWLKLAAFVKHRDIQLGGIVMYWYTLTPLDILLFEMRSSTPGERAGRRVFRMVMRSVHYADC